MNHLELRTVGCNLLALADGRLLTAYRFPESGARPFLYPIVGPAGMSLTAWAPPDHPHHASLWFAHGKVSLEGRAPVDLWLDRKREGHLRHDGFLAQEVADRQVRFLARQSWLTGTPRQPGEPLLHSLLGVTIWTGERGDWFMDLSLALSATCGALELGSTNESGLPMLRMADTVDVRDGGAVTDSEGRRNEAEIFGQRARWCDYSGPVNGREWNGITWLDHPGNRGHPAPWFVRDYGPWAPHVNYFAGPIHLARGETLTFRFRLHIHGGMVDAGQAEALWEAFAAE